VHLDRSWSEGSRYSDQTEHDPGGENEGGATGSKEGDSRQYGALAARRGRLEGVFLNIPGRPPVAEATSSRTGICVQSRSANLPAKPMPTAWCRSRTSILSIPIPASVSRRARSELAAHQQAAPETAESSIRDRITGKTCQSLAIATDVARARLLNARL
jgi:hypothetical protein